MTTRDSRRLPVRRWTIGINGAAVASAALWVAVSALPAVPVFAGEPVAISGTVDYTGTLGPVSVGRPILVLAFDDAALDGAPRGAALVDSNGGAFELTVPVPGDYFVISVLDTNGAAIPKVGDPYEIYLDRFAASGDPIPAPAEGLELSFDDTGSLPGVRGTVTYLGPEDVGESSPLRVEVFRTGDLTHPLAQEPRLTNESDSFEVILLGDGLRFMRVYLDLDDNGELDPDEPFTIYDGRTATAGDPLPQGVASIDISFGAPAVPTPTPGEPAVLSGTIDYTGSQGPVSESRPLALLLWSDSTLEGQPVALGLVSTNGGAFEVSAPAPGEYFLVYLLVSDTVTPPGLGDPFEIYSDRSLPPGEPVTIPQDGLTLSFDDSFGLPGVEGMVTYTGSLGVVSEDSPIRVEVYRDADLADRLEQTNLLTGNGDSFSVVLFEDRPHYLRGFLDLDRNDSLDVSEPFFVYDGKPGAPADPIPQDGSILALSFGDENASVPTTTATATLAPLTPRPPTRTETPGGLVCVGDCDLNGAVAINELVVGVNIALELTNVDECPSLDLSGNNSVTINELVQAVANALDGCPLTPG